MTRQYFYLVGHCIVGDDFVMDKVFLQEREAIKWGKTLASNNEEYTVSLYRQPMTRTGVIQFIKHLEAWKTPQTVFIDLTEEEKSEARKRMFKEAGVLS